MSDELMMQVIRYCQGEKTKAEILGHKEYYIPYKYQDPDRQQGCRR